MKPIAGRGQAPASVETWPVTGTLRFSDSLRSILSLLPVQMSTVAFLTAAAICCWVAGGMELGILVPVVLDALARKC